MSDAWVLANYKLKEGQIILRHFISFQVMFNVSIQYIFSILVKKAVSLYD